MFDEQVFLIIFILAACKTPVRATLFLCRDSSPEHAPQCENSYKKVIASNDFEVKCIFPFQKSIR